MEARELARLGGQMAAAIDQLRALTQRIAGNARQQAAALRDVVETTQGAARELAATREVVRAGRDDVGDARSAVALASRQIDQLAHTVERLAGHSRSAADAIDELLVASTKISAAVAFVEDVSARTNLLALNASIEAARAGVHGRGFGIVAHEMRKLAESTRTATTEMKALLGEIGMKAGAATDIARGTEDAVELGTTASVLAEQALASISSAVGSVAGAFERVDATIAGQAARTEELERTSHGVLDISRSHYTAATESTLSVNALAHHAKRLQVAFTAAVVPRRGVLRVATILNDSPSAAAWERFGALVGERTAGRVRVELDIPYTGNGRGELNAFDDLVGGQLALASVGCSVSGNVIPAAQLFELPYLFDSAEHAFAVLDSPAGREVLDEAGRVGLLAYGYLENGMRHFTSTAQPIRTPDDARGLRLRVMEAPVYLHFAQALGAVATTVPYFKLPRALETGEAQAQENPLTNIRGLDLPRVQRFLTLSGHSYTPQIVFANPAAMEALGTDRATVETALHEALVWHRARARAMEHDALAWLRARMEVIELDPAARAAFRTATAAVDEHLAHLVGAGRCAALRAAAAALRPHHEGALGRCIPLARARHLRNADPLA